jgi:phage FluMu gp28-like protein
MTGLGQGLVEYAQQKWGSYKVSGVNFSTTEPISDRIRSEGRNGERAKVTEIMATELLGVFEDRSLTIEVRLDADGFDDLRKPEKITSAGGQVSIAAVRDEAGHADHFWALALALRAANAAPPFAYAALKRLPYPRIGNMGMGRVSRKVLFA